MKILTKKLTISWSVCLLFIIIYIEGASGQCTELGRFGGRIGAICKHVCHCAGSAECDKNTGACTSCAAGYHGNTCQTQNVALRKNATQFSTFSEEITGIRIWYSADLAVDGDISTNHTDTPHPCTHTKEQSNGWWYVDLGAEYSIRYLRVYNREGSLASRLGGFTVRIGNSIPQIDTPRCYHNMDTKPPEVIDVTCNSTLRGRYVRIGLDSSPEYLTLCEVQVLVCTDYSFGADCNKRCHCKNEAEVCDKVTGYCPSGCAAGYEGVDCQTECPMNTYGNCTTICSTHCKPVAGETRQCNFIYGDCINTTGCQTGYIGSKCNQECPVNFYGNCTTECSAYCIVVAVETRQCDFKSGNCTIKSGCKPGYTGARCDQQCQMNTYGDCKTDCSTHCIAVAVKERQCNFISGHCADNTGCQTGYTGGKCDQKCPLDYYGDCTAPCSKYCLAVDDGKSHCDFISGNCTDPSRCQEPYTGARCDRGPCSLSNFGRNCRSECHCGSGSSECDYHTGACFYGLPCASNYHGNTCQKHNVEIGKNAYQSSTLDGGNVASLAVNGNTSTIFSMGVQCTHTMSEPNAWWYVDIGDEYNITSLKVYNRKSIPDRLRAFTVRIGSSDPRHNTLPLCYQHPNTTPAEIIDFTCASTMRGQYLRISLETRTDFLTLCEVQVFVCTDHSFGADCNKTCHCRSETDVCDTVTGYCASGCASGYMGVDCQKECPMNTYGDCMTKCSTHCKPVTDGTRQCNFVSGDCTDTTGCQAGYMEPKCAQECPMDTYSDCLTSCSTHCLAVDGGKRQCNYITGHCTGTPGCQAGYAGAKCDQACADRFFGLNCANSCNCKTATEVCAKTNGACSSGCSDGFQGEDCLTALAVSATSSGGLIAGVVVGCVLVIALSTAFTVILLRRRKARQSSQNAAQNGALNLYVLVAEDSNNDVSAKQPSGSAQPDIVASSGPIVEVADVYVDVDEDAYCNELTLRTLAANEGIVMNNLWDYVVDKKRSGGMKTEYEKLPVGLVHSATAAVKPENKGKSRYVNIYAYDHTRIALNVTAESTHTDYINANYVPGYQSPRKFIASQGPTTVIMDDFWRMVWQENCTKIVVLTQIIEGGKIKCDQYWPDIGSLSYGNVQVEMINVEDYADFSIRNLLIKNSEAHENRLVKQFHFKAWPDHGVPEYPTALIGFREKVTATRTSGRGPIVVHCSAGIGRTGTYIGLDYLIEQANAEGKVDVFGCVTTMRYYRVNMIQTEAQYEFLHDTLLEALSLSAMSMPSYDFMEKYTILKKTNTQSGKTYLQEQFDLLNLLTQSGNPTDSTFSEVPENMRKNRDPNVVAGDDHRVYLSTQIKGTDNYINAVYLPAYKESKKFIITQMPLANTVIDLWRMIYENKCRTIIMLNDDNLQDGSCYWPRERSTMSIGPFTITSDMDTNGNLYNMKPLRLKYSEEPDNDVNIQLFQSKLWSRSESVPQDASLIVTFLEDVEHWQQSTGNNMIVVHCMNGVERSGLYCAVNAVIDRLKVEQQVNISQTVKLLRARRPQIITNVEQFQFCHDAVVAYLESFHTYSNFT